MRLSVCFLVMLMGVDLSLQGRILAVLPSLIKSHHYLYKSILTALTSDGHEVVLHSPFPLKKPTHNIQQHLLRPSPPLSYEMDISFLKYLINEDTTSFAPKLYTLNRSIGVWQFKENLALHKLAAKNNRLRNEAEKKKDEYDLIILEPFLGQEILIILANKYNVPVIAIHPFGSFSYVNYITANPLNMMTVPDFSLPFSDDMSITQKMWNAISIIFSVKGYRNYLTDVEKIMGPRFFNSSDTSVLEDLLYKKIDLVFTNSHPHIHYDNGKTNNLMPVGGIHISALPHGLDKDVQSFLDHSFGIIYVSLGTLMPEHELHKILPDYCDIFFDVFKTFELDSISLQFLWKTSCTRKTNMPKNVMVYNKDLSQLDVLTHPAVELFITHGGQFSQHEALYSGVPVICIPFYGDQHHNCMFYQSRNVGLTCNFKDLNRNELKSLISVMLLQNNFQTEMDKLSMQYKDKKHNPREVVVETILKVIKQKGSPHTKLKKLHPYFWNFMSMTIDITIGVYSTIYLMITFAFMVIKKESRKNILLQSGYLNPDLLERLHNDSTVQ